MTFDKVIPKNNLVHFFGPTWHICLHSANYDDSKVEIWRVVVIFIGYIHQEVYIN